MHVHIPNTYIYIIIIYVYLIYPGAVRKRGDGVADDNSISLVVCGYHIL